MTARVALIVLAFALGVISEVVAQLPERLYGVVQDETGEPLYGASVYVLHHTEAGTTTDWEGRFSLSLKNITPNDTLIFTFVGYDTVSKLLSEIKTKDLIVKLELASALLGEITIEASRPIAETFSVAKIEKLQIYLNASAAGDPLRAVSLLPSSTNLDESASPSLRGSPSSWTRVYLNGVPVYRPVRNSTISGAGTFSLFNAELLKDELVFASNPPLTLGQSSAGLISLTTANKLESNQYDISAGLAHGGFLFSQKLGAESFVQAYANYQFDDWFLPVNKALAEDLKHFYTRDGGLHFVKRFGENSNIKYYGYLIDEGSDFISQQYNYTGLAKGRKKRTFHTLRYEIRSDRNVFFVNGGYDISDSGYKFGVIDSEQKEQQAYGSLNYKYIWSENLNTQIGVSDLYVKRTFGGDIPEYPFLVAPGSPIISETETEERHRVEAYFYGKWFPIEGWTIGAGVRPTIPINGQTAYLSGQLSAKYEWEKGNSLMLSGGRYYSDFVPVYDDVRHRIIRSDQIALEYRLDGEDLLANIGLYFKKERDLATERDILGLEYFLEQRFLTKFRANLSMTWAHGTEKSLGKDYPVSYLPPIFVKFGFDFQDPRLFSFGLNWQYRQGSYYTMIDGASFDPEKGGYIPSFSSEINGEQFGDYQTLNISANKLIPIGKQTIIVYITASNILDNKNEWEWRYTENYSDKSPAHYQRRTLYLGVVFKFGQVSN
ncbi:hypothetical protein FUAX_47370 (plasmid) [Fulvitalea axinellae]|uniref:TonB-dependent receptor n=1 Tax=Fulvitalea axinellae TaxID=1182444 RepID=A0AAU9CSN3_9BACT|nr:hypothetical protein FUAX_47370 [Fulvitalea axinellae]